LHAPHDLHRPFAPALHAPQRHLAQFVVRAAQELVEPANARAGQQKARHQAGRPAPRRRHIAFAFDSRNKSFRLASNPRRQG
jgi:hypothetical protein